METRKELKEKISTNDAEIKKLKLENLELHRKSLLLCDEQQWYTEKLEHVVIKRRPKITEEMLIGRIHWNEDFIDEGSGEVVSIERSKVVKINDEWQ